MQETSSDALRFRAIRGTDLADQAGAKGIEFTVVLLAQPMRETSSDDLRLVLSVGLIYLIKQEPRA